MQFQCKDTKKQINKYVGHDWYLIMSWKEPKKFAAIEDVDITNYTVL